MVFYSIRFPRTRQVKTGSRHGRRRGVCALRRRAREQGRSLDEIALEALGRGIGVVDGRYRHRDLDQFGGTWREDPGWDSFLEERSRIDEDLWK